MVGCEVHFYSFGAERALWKIHDSSVVDEKINVRNILPSHHGGSGLSD